MENIQVEKIKPKFYAQTCPNCNGRGHVGFDKHSCPTCGKTNTPGVVFVPVDGGMDEEEDSLS